MMDSTHEQIKAWLGAYYDGELTAALSEQVEAHLIQCEACQAEISSMRALSELLGSDPLPALPAPDAVFAAQVLRRLPAVQKPFIQRMTNSLFHGAPLALLAGWAFFQAVLWVAGGVLMGLRLFPGAQASLSELIPAAAGGVSLPLPGLLFALPMGLPDGLLNSLVSPISMPLPLIDWVSPYALVYLGMLAITAVAFASWFGFWWAYRARHSMTQMVE